MHVQSRLLFLAITLVAQGLFAAPPSAVATYECIGLYWQTPAAAECAVHYREAGRSEWKPALPLVYDPRDGEYRGSIVGLSPGTGYEVRLKTGEEAALTVHTWSDQFPIGETTHLPSGETTRDFTITKSGTLDGYHLVTVPPGGRVTLNAMNRATSNLVIEASYVIVRGLELRNAAQHAILIKPGCQHVVIEQCRITGWGRVGGSLSFGITEGHQDSAIYAEQGAGHLTIQRNRIEHPRGGSNDWETGHPAGPQGIFIANSSGGNVIRYNEIWSTEDHGFKDGIGGGTNFSRTGNLHRDSDVYGNIVRNCWDDAIETEGANMNVRVWGNYLDRFFNGIATAPVMRGPLYIFRNIWGESRSGHHDTRGGNAIKLGERGEFGGGRRYVFHNTILQPNGVTSGFSVLYPNTNCVTRNNIFNVRGPLMSDVAGEPVSDFDYDFHNGASLGIAKERHGVQGGRVSSLLLPSPYRLEFYPAARVNTVLQGGHEIDFGGGEKRRVAGPVVTRPNPIIDVGEVLPNFNDGFVGKAPDLGAFEKGAPPLEFGRRAYVRWDEGWAPWETVP